MVTLNRCATKNELAELLIGPEPSEKDPLVIHMEHCLDCQRKLSSLVADQEGWDCGRDVLLVTAEVEYANIGVTSDSASPGVPNEEPNLEKVPSLESGSESHALFQLGNYRILKTIGFGGMATVYHGLDLELNRVVAIKVLHPHLASAGTSRQRFLKEAQAAAAIVHPNVIPIYGVYLSDGRPYLAMPLVHGGSLQQRIDREGPIPLSDALSIALQISDALGAAHAKGVVHRDVKPANILLEDGNTRIILSDFGLARTLDDAHQTASGLISGTPAYMSPEQARGDSVDSRSDLYSLGCVLYAMCTGHAPYQASSTLKMLRIVDAAPFPSVHRYQEQLPLWVDSLIHALTAKLPSSRPASANEASQIIRECLLHCNNSTLQLPKKLQTVRRLSVSRKYALFGILIGAFCIGGVLNNSSYTKQKASRNDSQNAIDRSAAALRGTNPNQIPNLAGQPPSMQKPSDVQNPNASTMSSNPFVPSTRPFMDLEQEQLNEELSQLDAEFSLKLSKPIYQ